MPPRLVRSAAALVIAGLATTSAPALAASTDGEPLDLEWTAPPGCPSRAAVLEDIARILDRPGTDPPLARVTARAVPFRGEDGRWHVVLTISGDAASERTLDASSCEELTNAAALVLALRVDPTLLSPEIPLAAPPVPSAGSLPPAGPPAPPPPSPAPVPRRTSAQPERSASAASPEELPPADASPSRNTLLVGALVGGGIGEMPSVDVSAEGVATWKHDHLRFEPFFATGPVQHAFVSGSNQEGASVRLVRGGLRGCYAVIDRRLTLSGCVTGEVEGLWVDGFGTLTPQNVHAAEVAFGVGALATWHLTDRVAVRAQIEALSPFPRPRFVVDDENGKPALQVYDPSAFVGRGALGAEVSFF